MIDNAKGGNFFLHDSSTHAGVFLMASDGKDNLLVEDTTGSKSFLFGDGLNVGDSAEFGVDKQGPYLTLKDAQGFQSTLGVFETVVTASGQKRTRSAASLVMFGKDGNVIWSAP